MSNELDTMMVGLRQNGTTVAWSIWAPKKTDEQKGRRLPFGARYNNFWKGLGLDRYEGSNLAEPG